MTTTSTIAAQLFQMNTKLVPTMTIDEASEYFGVSRQEMCKQLSLFLNSLTDIKEVEIIDQLNNGNSLVFLTLVDGKLCVTKQHLHEHGDYELNCNTYIEINNILKLMNIKERCKHVLQNNIFINCTSNNTSITMPYIPVTTEMLFNRKSYNFSFICDKTIQLLKAVNFLHQNSLYHLDIKSQNIRFQSDGTLVLFDYDSMVNERFQKDISWPVCTVYCRPPEIHQSLNDTDVKSYCFDAEKVDIFGIGCFLASMLLGGRQLFYDVNETLIYDKMKAIIVESKWPRRIKSRLGNELFEILKLMLHHDPMYRPDTNTLLSTLRKIKF